MGQLKELLMQANPDLDTITVSKAEAHRLLHHAGTANAATGAQTKEHPYMQQPA